MGIAALPEKTEVIMDKKYKLTREEQETTIRASAADEEWDICSSDPRFIRYLKRQGYEPVPDHQLSGFFKFQISFIKLRIRKREIKVTDEQRAGLAKRTKFNVVKPAVARDKNENTNLTLSSVI
jgi:hypothetical protein